MNNRRSIKKVNKILKIMTYFDGKNRRVKPRAEKGGVTGSPRDSPEGGVAHELEAVPGEVGQEADGDGVPR
jgi:hypothetical protein